LGCFLLGWAALGIGPAEARPLLLGVAATNAAGVAVGDGTILFAPETHNAWNSATGFDESIVYTAALATADGFFVVVAEDGSAWRSSTPTATGFVRRATAASSALHAVTQIGSQLLAVGEGGVIVRATDQTAGNWVSVNSPTTKTLRGVATNSISSTVAVGDEGTILRGGVNGNDWQVVSIDEDRNFYAVLSEPGTGRFLAVGAGGAMWRSNGDGVSWSPVAPGGITITSNLRGLAQVGPATIAVGEDASAYYAANNFANWQVANTPIDSGIGAYDLTAVTFSGNDLLAVGSRRVILRSFIGLVWELNDVIPVVESSWGRVKTIFHVPDSLSRGK
jgi:photosystem II stability/assembly factor-like uncharacterized protein